MRFRPLIVAILIPLLTAAGLVLVPRVALAGNITANQIWSNLTGRYVIGVPGGSTSNGVQLLTWSSNGHSDQFWRFDYTHYSYQQIVNVNSGKCMGISGGSTSQGAAVIQWSCNGNPDQQWALGGTDGAYAYDTLVNKGSGMCVGIGGNYTGQGGNLVQWPCDGNSDKQWVPESAPWPGSGLGDNRWYACSFNGDTCSDTDPINVVFSDPNGNALNDITGDLRAMGWGSVGNCYNASVIFDAGGGAMGPSAVMATNVTNNGCGPVGGTRDHARMWPSPDGHTVFMAASVEMTTSTCILGLCNHSVVSYTDGRNGLINDEDTRLPGRVNFISNEEMQYPASSLGGVGFDGWIGVFSIGA